MTVQFLTLNVSIAAIWAVEKLKQYLEGYRFKIITNYHSMLELAVADFVSRSVPVCDSAEVSTLNQIRKKVINKWYNKMLDRKKGHSNIYCGEPTQTYCLNWFRLSTLSLLAIRISQN